MLRVWIFVGIILLIGVLLGIWLANRNRRRSAGGAGPVRPTGGPRPTGPDDDAQFLRSINIDPESLAEKDDDPDPEGAKDAQ
jgi:hypothetical protein